MGRRSDPVAGIPPEFAELNALRLAYDWKWDDLAERMKRRGVAMSPSTLCYLLKRAPASAQPRDRTLHKIREFLKYCRTQERRRVAARRAKSRVA